VHSLADTREAPSQPMYDFGTARHGFRSLIQHSYHREDQQQAAASLTTEASHQKHHITFRICFVGEETEGG
jgi:hypothetical protein